MSQYPLLQPLAFTRGVTWDQSFRWLQAGGVLPNDLTGFTAAMQLRERLSTPSPAITLTSANGRIVLGGALGTIRILVDATATAAVLPKDYIYDLIMTGPGGTPVIPLLYGSCPVTEKATRV